MKTVNWIKFSLIAAAAVSATAIAAAPALAGDVVVSVSGVREADGPLYVGLQTREQFMKEEGDFGAIVSNPAAGDLDVAISGAPAGEYALSVWHDIDGDGVFDRSETGYPLDGWAMSGAVPADRAPTFDDVKIELGDANISVAVTMIYAD